MSFAAEMVIGPSLSEAWLKAVQTVDRLDGRSAYHLVTHILRPGQEDPGIRAAADLLSSRLGYPTIETVANTIFPERFARTCIDYDELGERYRNMYPTIRILERANSRGTYFGRIVSYPSSSNPDFDQLADIIRKLRVELATPRPKASRFEIGIYAPEKDRSPMGFPCLSSCSLQLDHGSLHMIAHYRRQELICRGYGNYLGLVRLLRYVSDTVQVEVGRLTVVASAVRLDAPRYRVVSLVNSAPHELTGSEEVLPLSPYADTRVSTTAG